MFYEIFNFNFYLFFLCQISYATSFVDSLAKEYGKKNGCYSISLGDKRKLMVQLKKNTSKDYLKR